MDGDTESTNTSIEDKTEDFCDNPTRDALAEGLMCLLKPTIDSLDERVRATRQVVEYLRWPFSTLTLTLHVNYYSFPKLHSRRIYYYLVHRISQVELRQQIDGLADEIKKISDEQQCPLDLESYVKKLLNAKRRVTVVSNILQVAQVKMRLEFLKVTLSTTCIIF